MKIPPTHGGVWVYGNDVEDSELYDLASKYDLDHNTVRDVYDNKELPRVEFGKTKTYIFLRMPHATERGSVKTNPLLVAMDDRDFFIISPSETSLPRELIAASLPVNNAFDTPSLLLGTLAAMVVTYEELVKHTASIVQDTGRRLRTHEVTNADFIHFVTVERNFNEYEMNLEGIKGVAQRLKDSSHFLPSEEDNEALDDVVLHVQQLLVAIKSHQQTVVSIRGAYSTIANNTLNERMKLLTALTVLVALPNVFYGMFGMNVPVPGSEQPWAFVAIVSTSVALVLLVYIIARRLKIF